MWIAPGQPDDVITIFMGGGRTRAGRVGTGIGYNAFEVMRSDVPYGVGEVSKTGEQTTIASTQIHFNMEGRAQTIEVFVDNPDDVDSLRQLVEIAARIGEGAPHRFGAPDERAILLQRSHRDDRGLECRNGHSTS